MLAVRKPHADLDCRLDLADERVDHAVVARLDLLGLRFGTGSCRLTRETAIMAPVLFETIAELPIAPGEMGNVYAEGWQSWSPAGAYPIRETGPRAPDELRQTMGWRPGMPAPECVTQAEGILAVALPGEPVRAWFPGEPEREVPTLRLEVRGRRAVVSADGPLDVLTADTLADALAAVGERLRAGDVAPIGDGWCSWSYYFSGVAEADVVENLEAAVRLQLPLEFVQIDDGYETCVGDWLDIAPRFGSLQRVAARIAAAGKRPGIWTAPFLVGEHSALAREHPDWLTARDAGWNWNQRLRVLDVTQHDAAEHLQRVFSTLRAWGFEYYKLDFLYAGAIEGIDVYRHGLELIRAAVGADAVLVGCGAPLLPSIGLVDAMRIGPDVLPSHHMRRSTSGT